MAPVIDCLKKREFKWSKSTARAFKELKERLTIAPVLRFPNFSKVFEATCDISGKGIGGVLNQECHPVAFSSEKLNEVK